MKKLIASIFSVLILFSLCSCSSDSKKGSDIQGVSISDSGDVTVTFRTNGKGIEDVLGSELSDKNTFYVSWATDSGSGFYVYWYYVEGGGIVSERDGIYRYSPTAEVSRTTGTVSPPNSVLILSKPSEDEILKAEDAGALAEKYGIILNY